MLKKQNILSIFLLLVMAICMTDVMADLILNDKPKIKAKPKTVLMKPTSGSSAIPVTDNGSIQSTAKPQSNSFITKGNLLEHSKPSSYQQLVSSVKVDFNQSLNEKIEVTDDMSAMIKKCEDGCISRINGKYGKQVVFTPGTPEVAIKYRINGSGFGNTKGQVYLTGPFSNRPNLRADTWSDIEIIAYFEGNYKGELDHEEVGLVVIPANGKNIVSPATSKFVAQRVKTTLTYEQLKKSFRGDVDAEFTKLADGRLYISSGAHKLTYPKHGIEREHRDVFNFDNLKPGFEAIYASMEIPSTYKRIDKNDACRTKEFGWGSADFHFEGKHIVIARPMNLEWKTDEDCPFGAGRYYSSSANKIEVIVEGPAGVEPYQ